MSDDILEKGLRQISLSGRVAKGCNCTLKAILKQKAKIVFLANDVDNKDYKAVVTGLCKKYRIQLVTVPQKGLLGKALGLTNLRSNGEVRRQINCGACAVLKYGAVECQEIEAFRQAYDPEKPEGEQE